MKLLEGQISRLGSNVVRLNQGFRSYSMVQIGDKTLTDVLIDEKLNNFLEDGIATSTHTKLWFMRGGKVIMALQVGNQPRYFGTMNPMYYLKAALVFVMFPGFCLILALQRPPESLFIMLPFVALFLLIWCLIFLRKILDYNNIVSLGGTKV